MLFDFEDSREGKKLAKGKIFLVSDERVEDGQYHVRVSYIPKERNEELIFELYQEEPVFMDGRVIEEDEEIEYNPNYMKIRKEIKNDDYDKFWAAKF